MVALLTEVVGGSGRIGSQFMRLTENAICIPRGICPGSLSSDSENPIFVCAPANSWKTIYDSTFPKKRCSDLVFVGNGLLPDDIPLENVTIVVPHYAVLKVGDRPSSLEDSAPPTYVGGKHSNTVDALLRKDGIVNVQCCSQVSEIWVHMVQKLLWSSCLWLLCHTINKIGPPASVSQVHLLYSVRLHELVHELWPSAQKILAQRDSASVCMLPTMEQTLLYFQQYSFAISNAIPSLQLAKAEVELRNGVFTANWRPEEQPIHFSLLSQALGTLAAKSLFQQSSFCSGNNGALVEHHIVDLRSSIGMAVYGQLSTDTLQLHDHNFSSIPHHVLIVGAGMLGSSVAYHLAQQLHENGTDKKCIDSITVIDAACVDMSDPGPTTEASFGWINANFQKHPHSYQQFNVLGMRAWHHDPVLCILPQWNGSILKIPKALEDSTAFRNSFGFYNSPVGPLTELEVHQMEPNINFATNARTSHGTPSAFYSFPSEGSVDPGIAVQLMRLEAAKLGVSFIWKHKVRHFLRDSNGFVHGIQYNHADCDDGSAYKTLEASEIIVAAGMGSADDALGGLPLQQNATTLGQTIFYENMCTTNDPNFAINKVIVDMVNQYHLLQRLDGTIVLGGGGALQVGGINITTQGDEQNSSALLNEPNGLSCALLPRNAHKVGTKQAQRPIPLDGLPSIGYFPIAQRKNLYSLVSHSGVTLASILGALAATGIQHQGRLSLDVLHSYRPGRFGIR